MAESCQEARYKCPLCVFHALTIQLVLSHLRLVHSNDPNFSVVCGIGGCSTTSRTFSALYQHIYKKHKEVGIIKNRGNGTAATVLPGLPLDLSSTVNCTETLECSHELPLDEGY